MSVTIITKSSGVILILINAISSKIFNRNFCNEHVQPQPVINPADAYAKDK